MPPNDFSESSAAIEPLPQIVLTGSEQFSVSKRKDSHSQVDAFFNYTPDASELSGAGKLTVKVQYTNQAPDYEGPLVKGTYTWRYMQQTDETLAPGGYAFSTKYWVINANATQYATRSPHISFGLGARVIRFSVQETGVSLYGTVDIDLSRQKA